MTRKLFVPNGRFRCLRGHQYFVNGEVIFTSQDKDVDGTYRTFGGPVFSLAWKTWRKCNLNVRYALRRLLGVIEPETLGADAFIRDSQEANILRMRQFFVQNVAPLYQTHFLLYTNARDEIEKHLNDPHPKRALRNQAYTNLKEEGKLEQSDSNFVDRHVGGKLKTAEKAKSVVDETKQKYPRMIFDLKVPASLIGSEVMSLLKQAMADNPIITDMSRIQFIKTPNPFILKRAFQELYDTEYILDFICFSDDSAFTIKLADGIHYCMADISSADASYTPELFELLFHLVPASMQDDVRRLIEQCKMPMKIRDCNDPKIYVLLKPLFAVLYSGSTLTTAINTLANFLIALAIEEGVRNGSIQTIADIQQAIRRIGFLVTISECRHYEELQFLKHSPVRDTLGNWQPMLNFGVLLRASGMCFGDYPGRGDLKQRILAFQRGLLQGAYPYTSCQLLDAMWQAVGQGPVSIEAAKEFKYKVDNDSSFTPYRVDESSFCRRYDLNPVEFAYLTELVSNYSYGYAINTSAVEKICLKDYELATATYSEPSYFFTR